jgi:rhodanese-related sulfurtransferase
MTILDVREAWERELCAIDGSLPIPLGELPERLADVPGDRLVVVLCHHGNRSARAAAWLRSQGYANTTNLEGGIDQWARLIDSSMKVY